MTGCNCSPLPDYAADYIENLNKWVHMNQDIIKWYLSWYQMWLPMYKQEIKDVTQ